MSYLGNIDPKTLFAENVRDDLVPDGTTTLFNLTQEVPGGYESNIFVFRKEHQFIRLLSDVATLTLDDTTQTIECSDENDSVILTRIQVGDFIKISGAVDAGNNKITQVTAVSYADPVTTITVSDALVDETGGTITIDISQDKTWEVLEPETDYIITGTGSNYNKQIQLSEAPDEEDYVYVVHKGNATYNFVPSAKSVGPDQLQENLRDFSIDRFSGDGATTIFELHTEPINSKAIMVTVDGVLLDGDDNMDSSGPFTGDWFLDSSPASGETRPHAPQGKYLTFSVAPSSGAEIRVLFLGFSTISRRASLSAGQVSTVPTASIGATQLANGGVTGAKIANDTIVNEKLVDNTIKGEKILLDNNEDLRGLQSDTVTEQALLKIDASEKTVLQALATIILNVASTDTLDVSASAIKALVADYDLGTSGDKFGDLFLSGDASVDGAVSATGNVTGANITTLTSDVSSLETNLDAINGGRSSYDNLLPAGAVMPYAGASAPTGWLLCNGQAVSRSTYSDLFAICGSTYGGGNGSTTFNVPDMRQRFPLGKADSGEGSTLGGGGGVAVTGTSTSIGHTHGFSHTHDLSASGAAPSHTHGAGTIAVTVLSHSHSLQAHTHDIDHYHFVNPHFHRINSNEFTIKVPGAYAGSVAPSFPSAFTNADSLSNRRFLISDTDGTPYDVVLQSTSYDASKAFTKRWIGADDHDYAKTNLPSSPYSAKDGGADLASPGTANVTTQRAQTYGSNFPPSSFKLNSGTPSTSSTSNVSPGATVSGSTGVPDASSTITSTGSTTSISTSTSDVGSPPYRVLNYIIKV